MDDAVRVGVLGAGRMAGATMLEIMAGHPAARPVAWYEIDPYRPDTVERIPRLLDRGIERCESLEALLARRDVDVVLNATPHFAHAETTIAALRAGKPVLCEKPPACSRAECAAMAEAQRAAGRPLMVHFQHVLRPAARRLEQAIVAGQLGRIRRVTCLSLWWRNVEYYTRVDWAGKRLWQGRPCLDGVLVNQSIHYLNQSLTFAQRSGLGHVAVPRTLRAALYRFHPGNVLEMEDTAVLLGTLDNPDATECCFATTTCAADAAGPNRLSEYFGIAESHRISVEGDAGRATWDGTLTLELDGQPAQRYAPDEGPWPFYFHLRDVLAGRVEPLTPIHQARRTMETIFTAYDAAGDVRPVDWARHEEVSAVLRRCADERRLPAELPGPPDWA